MSEAKLDTLEEIEGWMAALDAKFSAGKDQPVSQRAASMMADAIAALAKEVRQLKGNKTG